MKTFGTLIVALVLLPCLARADPELVDVPDAAKGAAATVDRFFAALSAGDLEKAGAELYLTGMQGILVPGGFGDRGTIDRRTWIAGRQDRRHVAVLGVAI